MHADRGTRSHDPSQGYVTDTSYTDRFFRELSPAWLNYVAALNGAPTRAVDRPFSYLELGCGFGHSAIVNAGAFPQSEFHACDVNPVHIDGARGYATALGIANIQFHHASFDDLLALKLPPFDFIALHGVYSWIGAEARDAVRRIIAETLKPDGLVYVSYNCLPGWTIEVPLRRLLMELAAAGDGGTDQRTTRALLSLKQLSDGTLRYFNANPAAAAAVDAYVRGPSNYLVHEFLNEAWEPFYSIDVADEMARADLGYVGSATLADNHPALVVSERAARAIATLQTDRLRQLAIDFAVDRRFRRDVFIRRAFDRESASREPRLDAAVIGCPDHPDRIGSRVQVPRGAITFQDHFIRELRELMHRGSTTIGEAVGALAGAGRDANEIARNLTFLVASGALTPFAKTCVQPSAALARRPANALVSRVLEHVIEHRVARAIPSEILGNGVPIAPIEARGLTAWLEGVDSVDAMAARLQPEAGADAPSAAARLIDDLIPSLIRLGSIV